MLEGRLYEEMQGDRCPSTEQVTRPGTDPSFTEETNPTD